MIFVGRQLLPTRTPGTGLSEDYPIREYLSEVQGQIDSLLLGRAVRDVDWGELSILHIDTLTGDLLKPRSDY